MPAGFFAALLTACKYFALYFTVIVEGFLAEIAIGALASQGVVNIYVAVILAAVGDLTSDYLFFTFGGKISNSRFAKLFGLTPANILRAERIFAQHGPTAIVVAKLSSYLAVPVIVAAGAIRMPKKTFWPFCISAASLKAVILVLLGYYFGKEVHHLTPMVVGASIAISILGVGYIVGMRYLASSSKKVKTTEHR